MSNAQKPDPDRRYSSEEVADIIRLSLQDESRRNNDALIDYDELIAIANDVGVTSDQIDHAVYMLQEAQQTRDKESSLWLRFKAHALLFAAVNLLLIAINLLTGSDTFWAMYSVWLGLVSVGSLRWPALCPTVCGDGHAARPQPDGSAAAKHR
jgi:hypothetical protein